MGRNLFHFFRLAVMRFIKATHLQATGGKVWVWSVRTKYFTARALCLKILKNRNKLIFFYVISPSLITLKEVLLMDS